MRTFRKLALASVSLLSLTTPAFAQDPPATAAAPTEEAESGGDIVVTGTLLRGIIAPVGSQAIGVSLEKITEIGAANTSDLIANVPQAGNFLAFVGVRGSSNFSLAVNRPNLRYFGNASSSTNSTLLLVDGHRLPGMGVSQTTPDLDAIPAAAIERVEIVTDGGSATYGSDAVGGVMNFITRRRFDGVEVKGSYGLADNYSLRNASIIAGKTWGKSSAYLVYDYSWHDWLYGGERDWSQNRDWINNTGANLDCPVPNVQAGTTTYALPGLTPGLGNRCDASELRTFYPRETKHSFFGSLLVDTGTPLSVGFKAYYVKRTSHSDGGPLSAAGGVRVPNTSPYRVAIPGVTGDETFIFDYSPVFGNHTPLTTGLESYGFTPSVKVDLSSKWQLNALVNLGRGVSSFLGEQINAAVVSTAALAGTFDPVHLTAATNAATLATAHDWFTYARATNQLINARAVIDGSLFTLPAGDVRIAVGVEYMNERYQGGNSRATTRAGIPAVKITIKERNVKSVFGEINIPVLGEDTGLFHSLSLSASGRYDDYSDFGHTFNPKIGVNFEPVDWLKLRGNWGKAFQAPGLSDLAAAGSPTLNILPLSVTPFRKPGLADGGTNHNILVALSGTQLPLNPQKAKTWSVGFDVKPPVISGFGFGATYYNIDFDGFISIRPFFDPAFYAQFPNDNVTYDKGNPALQTFLDKLTALAGNPQALANLPLGINSVYAVIDARATNLQRVKTSGIDFYANYRTDTGFGDIFANVAGTYILKFTQQANPNAPLIEGVHVNTTRLRVTTTAGVDIGNLRAQGTWNFSQGYKTVPTAANLQQARVAGYHLFNLFFQYKVPGDSALLKDLAFTLNVDNVFDQDPPLFRSNNNSLFGVANGFTLGRLVKFGISKKF